MAAMRATRTLCARQTCLSMCRTGANISRSARVRQGSPPTTALKMPPDRPASRQIAVAPAAAVGSRRPTPTPRLPELRHWRAAAADGAGHQPFWPAVAPHYRGPRRKFRGRSEFRRRSRCGSAAARRAPARDSSNNLPRNLPVAAAAAGPADHLQLGCDRMGDGQPAAIRLPASSTSRPASARRRPTLRSGAACCSAAGRSPAAARWSCPRAAR